MASAVESGNVAPRTGWRTILGHAAADVFSMMVGVSVQPVESPMPALDYHVTGTVGIAGAISAIFSLRCSAQTANSIASQMLGVPLEEAAANQRDAVGEICNIIAGDFKTKIGLGDKCMLSLPTVITGGDYRLHAPEGERVVLELAYGDERIEIVLNIPK